MKRVAVILTVTALWLLPYFLAQPARPEPDPRTHVQRAFGIDPERAPA